MHSTPVSQGLVQAAAGLGEPLERCEGKAEVIWGRARRPWWSQVPRLGTTEEAWRIGWEGRGGGTLRSDIEADIEAEAARASDLAVSGLRSAVCDQR